MIKPPSYILLLAELLATLEAASHYCNPKFPEVKKSFEDRLKELQQVKGIDITPADIVKSLYDLQEYEKVKATQDAQ